MVIPEIFIGGLVVYALFGDHISARVELLHEQARELRLNNDAKEYGDQRDDEETP